MTSITLRAPVLDDGADIWRLADDAGELDLNSSYAYLLWCRDFATTSVVAVDEDADPPALAGFITGYRRPDDPDVLVVWQVAVDGAYRGQGVAGRMLDHLAEVLVGFGGSVIETTVTDDNEPSLAMFSAFARRHGVGLDSTPLFTEELFPDDHATENLLRMRGFGENG